VILLIASMGSGILALSALTGAQYDGQYDISTWMIQFSGKVQWATFGVGVLMFCIFALGNLDSQPGSEAELLQAAIYAHQHLGQFREKAGDVVSAEDHYNQVIQLWRKLRRDSG
jgi:hypothetical protein